ncbi:sensor histidine kinase [Halobacillus seohaensis]|uniref:sensor histidine kinase n=1 Tax=Halobacillus seohaensis TaxID=447421 RepID=UPI0036F42DBD
MIQNNIFSNYSEKQEGIEEKYTYVESIDDTVHEAVFDYSRFVNSENMSYLDFQQQYEQTIYEDLQDLKEMSTSEADETYIEATESFQRYYFKDILPLTTSYVQDNQTEKISSLFNNTNFNDEINQINNESDKYESNLDDQMSQTIDAFDRNRHLIDIAVFTYIIVILFTVFIIVRIISRRIGSPLRELSQAANQLSAGERNVSVKALNRHDELGALSEAFRRMISKIRRSEVAEQQLNKELSEKNTDLEQLVYIASHDLRSPLINIQGFNKELQASFKEIDSALQSDQDIDDIRKQVAPLIEEDIPEAFYYIVASTDKMDALLNALLRLSRIGRQRPDIQPLDMNQMISEVVKNYEFQANESNIRLEVGDLPQAMGDAGLIDQVISNLIGNALKFLHPDRAGIVKVYGYVENEQAIYCVEDNGIGISEQYQQQIFNLFEKIDPYVDGEGLGLTIMRKILERHAGEIWVESELDMYSKFYFSLPKVAQGKTGKDEQ